MLCKPPCPWAASLPQQAAVDGAADVPVSDQGSLCSFLCAPVSSPVVCFVWVIFHCHKGTTFPLPADFLPIPGAITIKSCLYV